MGVSAASRKILVIDDEQDIVDLISEVLARDNYVPIVATKWTEAIEAIGRQSPDLLLLDLKMPTIDGAAILEFIRKEGIDLPVIIVSGFLTDDVMEDLSALGVSAFIRKPFKVSVLRTEIENVIGDVPSQAAEAEEPAPSSEPAGETGPGATGSKDAQVLGAFERLQGDRPKEAEAPAAGPPAAEVDSEAKDKEVLEAFKKLSSSHTEPAPQASPRPGSAPPSDPERVAEAFRKLSEEPEAKPEVSQPASTAPPATPQSPLAAPPQADVGLDVEVPQESAEHRRRSHHSRRRPRSRSASRRNLLYMGIITVVCIFIAGFLAMMQWYAAQVDVAEIKAGVKKSMTDQVKEELLKEMKQEE